MDALLEQLLAIIGITRGEETREDYALAGPAK